MFKCGTWYHITKSCQKSAGKRSEKSNEESSYVLAIIDGTSKPKNSMFCTVDEEKYHLFTAYTRISDTDSSCHITNQSAFMYNKEIINKPVQGSCGDQPRKGNCGAI